MKKIIILAVLLLMGTVGMLQADTEYPLELIVEVHFTQNAYDVEIGYDREPCPPFSFYRSSSYGDVQAPDTRTYTTYITSSTQYPACAGVESTTSSGETILRTKDVPPGFSGNPIVIYWPGGGGGEPPEEYDPTIPEPE
jgi:hypothetical protein